MDSGSLTAREVRKPRNLHSGCATAQQTPSHGTPRPTPDVPAMLTRKILAAQKFPWLKPDRWRARRPSEETSTICGQACPVPRSVAETSRPALRTWLGKGNPHARWILGHLLDKHTLKSQRECSRSVRDERDCNFRMRHGHRLPRKSEPVP